MTELTSANAVSGRTEAVCRGGYLVPPCPVTQRLAARLESQPFSGPGGGASPLCRCQNMGVPTYSVIAESGSTASVHEDIGFGPPGRRWTVVEVDGMWYVDDQDLGCAATSIYSSAYDHATPGAAVPPSPPAC